MSVDTSFVLIEADWPARRAREIIEGLDTIGDVVVDRVVAHRVYEGEDLYYVFSRSRALLLLPDSDVSVREALNLRESEAAPTTAADTPARDRPTVVVSRGRVAGIVLPAKERTTRSGLESYEAVHETEVTRAVEASAPSQAALGETVSLVVTLLDDVSRPETAPVVATLGETLDVVVQAKGVLAVEGRADGALMVTAGRSPSLLFKIAGRKIGPGEVLVLVFQQGQEVASVPVAIRVVETVTDSETNCATAPVQPVAARPPDLLLHVTEHAVNGQVGYFMVLSAADPALGLNLAKFGPFVLQQEPRKFFEDLYTDIESIVSSASTASDKVDELGRKGDYLFEKLIPEAARKHLWALRSRIRSVHVQSEEPWIPWELIRLSGVGADDTIVTGGFLCEEFEVTRWVPEVVHKWDLTMNEVGVVVPASSGLPASGPELDALKGLFAPPRQLAEIPAHDVILRKALAAAKHDTIHFTGHGVAGGANADHAEIRLDDDRRLRPEDLTGVVFNMRKRRPLVFLNACEIGRAGMGLTGPGGWPRGFLAAGAGAFIGPFWKIDDARAATFAVHFYEALLGGATVGGAARAARLAIKSASDPSWLAYSVYAHADARLASHGQEPATDISPPT